MIWYVLSFVHYAVCYEMATHLFKITRIMVPYIIGKGTCDVGAVEIEFVPFFVLLLISFGTRLFVNQAGEWALYYAAEAVCVIAALIFWGLFLLGGGCFIYCLVMSQKVPDGPYMARLIGSAVVVLDGLLILLWGWVVSTDEDAIPLTWEEILAAHDYEVAMREQQSYDDDDDYVPYDPEKDPANPQCKNYDPYYWEEERLAEPARENHRLHEYARLAKEAGYYHAPSSYKDDNDSIYEEFLKEEETRKRHEATLAWIERNRAKHSGDDE